MVLVGFNPEKTTKEELTVLMDFLQRRYPNMLGQELLDAFELGVSGRLDVDLSHYQSFNTLYVSNVIQSYKRYQTKHKSTIPKDLGQLPEPTKTQEQINKESYDFIEKVFKAEGQPPIIANWPEAYNYLESKGLISMSNEFKQDVKAKLEYDAKVRKAGGRDMSLIIKQLNRSVSFENECKKRAVIKYFKDGNK